MGNKSFSMYKVIKSNGKSAKKPRPLNKQVEAKITSKNTTHLSKEEISASRTMIELNRREKE